MEFLNPPAESHSIARPVSSRRLLEIVFRRRRVLLVSFLAVLAGAIFALCLTPRSYEAEMKILVQDERVDPVVSSDANVLEQDRGLTQDEVSSEVELFQSRDSLEKVVIDCGLDKPDSSFAGALKWRVLKALRMAPDRETRTYRAVLNLQKDLQVIPINNSNVIRATYDARSPQLAAEVLKRLGDLYLAKSSSVHRPQGVATFFQQQADQFQRDLAETEGQLVDLSRGVGVASADLEKQITLQVTLQKIGDVNVSLQQTRASIEETKERMHALQGEEASVPTRITTSVRTSDNPELLANLKSTLLTLQIKRTELLEKYDEQYPTVQEVEKQIDLAQAAIADAQKAGVREETTDQDPTHEWVKTEREKAEADLVGLQGRAEVLSNTVHSLQDRTLVLGKAAMAQQALLRTEKADQDSYLLYRRKTEEARIADALDRRGIVNAAIAEPPVTPLVPSGFSAGAKLLLSVLIAAFISLGFAFSAEYMDPSFRAPDEITECLGIPLLASFANAGALEETTPWSSDRSSTSMQLRRPASLVRRPSASPRDSV